MRHYIFTLLLLALSSSAFSQVKDTDPIAPIDAVPAKVLSVAKQTTSIKGIMGLYDRVEMERTANVDELTVVVVPCVVDGYFFGADAKRYEVKRLKQIPTGTSYDYKYFQFETREMEDGEDFLPNHYYLVRPTVQTDKIVACEAGLKTEVGDAQKLLANGPAFMAIPNGDVNEDGNLTQADVEGIVSFVLQKNTEGLNKVTADVNKDGVINTKDVVLLINSILSGEWSKAIP